MELKKVNETKLKEARKAGMKRKAPKKPSRNASKATLETYVKRYNAWVDDVNKAAAENAQKEAMKRKIFG